MNETEEKIKKLLRNKYDFVFKTENGSIKREQSVYLQSLIKAKLSELCDYEEEKSLNHFLRTGVPDFLAFNSNFKEVDARKNPGKIEGSDFIFVEAKKKQDSLRTSQLDWFSDFSKIPSEIWVATEKGKHRLSKYRPENFESAFVPNEFMELMKWEKGEELEINIRGPRTIEIKKPEPKEEADK